MTPEAIIDAAVAGGIAIVAFTDHNTALNIQRSLDHAARYADRLLVIPGVEVTTAHGHLLVYFSPADPADVQRLLNRVGIVGNEGSPESHTTKSMADVMTEAMQLGGICVAAHIDSMNTGFEMLDSGFPNWKKDLLAHPGLYGLESVKSSNLSWYSDEDSDALKRPERRKLVERRRTSPATASRVELAPLQGSDAHSLDQFRARQTTRISFLKMDDLSFDGLRTALIDPAARVRPTALIPPAVPRLLGMYLDGGFLSGVKIQFAANLNCFIGGRGSGKSTALRAIGHALGIDDEFEGLDNCPDEVVLYCEDTNGVVYRYERQRGSTPTVRAREEGQIEDAPVDSFRVEYYRQGDLAKVAEDPLRNPSRLQAFLDRHLALADLESKEAELLDALEQNSAVLKPLEIAAGQLAHKEKVLTDLDKKLELAKTGKVKEIADLRIKIAKEETFLATLSGIADMYRRGLSLAAAQRDFAELRSSAGALTGDHEVERYLSAAKTAIDSANTELTTTQTAINSRLRSAGDSLAQIVSQVKRRHAALNAGIEDATANLRQQGLSPSLTELNRMLSAQQLVAGEVAKIHERAAELRTRRSDRGELLRQLTHTRAQRTDRRKQQLVAINQNLARFIQDYTIVIHYDAAGVAHEFVDSLLEAMHGTHLQRETAVAFCAAVTPTRLAELVERSDVDELAKVAGVGSEWARQLAARLGVIQTRHRIEVIDKPPCPVIKVMTKGRPSRQLRVTQLSDGQKHTILLTIAMLADDNMPLVIDQPEDDLDNAFIYSSVVQTLRRVKGRRQVVLVTHNANIAVLGDSELILPMQRSDEFGVVSERGSIDRAQTRKLVQDILEGGEAAFQRRREIYGH